MELARGHGVKLQLDQGSLDGVVSRPAELPYDFPGPPSVSRLTPDEQRRVA